MAVLGDGAAGHFLGPAVIVLIGGVDEVDPGLASVGDDALGGRRIGRAAEHHRAETQGRDLEPALTQAAILHDALACRFFAARP
jgi:hypothetical protein